MSEPVIDIHGLNFAWPGASGPLLDIPHFQLGTGERLFLRGPSGSGKSTLLGLIAGVLEPQGGQIKVLGHDLAAMSGAQRDKLRADRLGVIFQLFNLVPYLSVVENAALPARFSERRRQQLGGDVRGEATRLLARLGMDDPAMLARRVLDLSVGQQQRVAAARALIGAPDIVIADEPTSALDADTRDRFIELISEEAARTGAALLFVSHDAGLARHFDRDVDLQALNAAAPAREAA